MSGDGDVRSLNAAEDEGGQFVVPWEAIDAGAIRGVFRGHQFNGRLGELRGRGVGPVYIPPGPPKGPRRDPRNTLS